LTSISFTDKDSRPLRKRGFGTVGYNVQNAVDSKHHLIVASEVTQKSNDLGLLSKTLEEVEAVLGPPNNTTILADKGYYEGYDIKRCEDAGYQPCVPELRSASEAQGLFAKKSFIYNEDDNTYLCPAEQTLVHTKTQKNRRNKIVSIYKNEPACSACTLKSRCTKGKSRMITRWEDEEYLERNRQRFKDAPDASIIRKSIVEHPFGTIKDHILCGGFNVRGLEHVQAEMSLAQLAYNLKRVTKIVPLKELMKTLRGLIQSFISKCKITLFKPYTVLNFRDLIILAA
jgi:hypothetical protein